MAVKDIEMTYFNNLEFALEVSNRFIKKDENKLKILNAGRKSCITPMICCCTLKTAIKASTDLTDEEKQKLIQALTSRYNATIGDYK